jgi:hypothetical protein
MRIAPVVALVAVLGAPGCTAHFPLPIPIPYPTSEGGALPIDQAAVAPDSKDALKVGDDVLITNKHTGKRHAFTVVQLMEDGFIGEHDNGKTYRVFYQDLAKLEVERHGWRVLPFWWPP